MWQHVQLSEQIRPWDTLACCWGVKQPTNKQTPLHLCDHSREIARHPNYSCCPPLPPPLVCLFVGWFCGWVGWLVGCLVPASMSMLCQGQICWDGWMCCHTETELVDQTCHRSQSYCTETCPASPAVTLKRQSDHTVPISQSLGWIE